MAVTQSTKKRDTKIKEESKIDKSPEVKTPPIPGGAASGEKEMKTEKSAHAPDTIKSTNLKETKKEEIKETKKKVEVVKKDVAVANGYSLRISPKQSVYVCKVIRGKSPEAAIKRLEEVINEKRPIPMAGLEVGHKKGKGFAGGKFPKNACKAIIEIVKQASANAIVNGIENPVITIAKSDRASAPYRRAGRKAKRTHIHIEVRDKKTAPLDVTQSTGGKK